MARGRPRVIGSSKGELHPYGTSNTFEIRRSECADQALETLLADGCQLVGHGLSLLAIQQDVRLAWIQAFNIACEWDNLDAIEVLIGIVVTDDHGRATLLDF